MVGGLNLYFMFWVSYAVALSLLFVCALWSVSIYHIRTLFTASLLRHAKEQTTEVSAKYAGLWVTFASDQPEENGFSLDRVESVCFSQDLFATFR